MADTALKDNKDSGKAERLCAWHECGKDISHMGPRKTLCSIRCKKASYNHRNRDKVNAAQRLRNATESARAARKRYNDKRNAASKVIRDVENAISARIKVELWVWSLDRLSPKGCVGCDDIFYPRAETQIRCKKGCSRRQENPEYYAQKDRDYRSRHPEKMRTYYRERDAKKRRLDPIEVRQKERASERRRAAKAALSAILLPVRKVSETS